jgi:hypothetical protein
MYRWSKRELEETDAIDFAIEVLEERRARTTNPDSLLNQKITETQNELRKLKHKLGRKKCKDGQ